MSLLTYPLDVVTEILSWLKIEDCRQLACCSRDSYDLVKDLVNEKMWRRVKLDLDLFYDREEVEQFTKHVDLTSELCVRIGGDWVIAEEEKQVFDNLEFVLKKCNPTKITSFELQNGYGDICEDLLCTHLSLFTNLIELSVDLDSRMECLLPQISLLPNLQSLVLKGSWRLPEDAFWELVQLKSLRKLGIHNKETFWEIDEVICEMEQLTELDLSRTEIMDDAVINICNRLGNLQALTLGGCTTLYNDCLSKLCLLTSLKKLRVSGIYSVNENVLCHILAAPSLKSLDITYISLSGHGLGLLGQMTGLEELIIAHCNFENKELVHLTKLDNLQLLNVNKCKQLTNDGLQHIAKLKSLRHLQMYGCPLVTDAESLLGRVFVDYAKPIPLCVCISSCCCDRIWA